MAAFLASYGLPLLFLVVALEAAGLPLPGETTLIAAAALAAHGDVNLFAVIGVGAAAAIVGDNAGYWLGRKGGRAAIERWPWLQRVTDRLLPRSERFFARHGAKAIVLARFLPVLRVTGAWMAGLSWMPWWRFLFWNAVGSTIWAAAVAGLTFYGGRAAIDAVAQYGLYGAVAVAFVVGLAVAGWQLAKRRLEPRPSAAAGAALAMPTAPRWRASLAGPLLVVASGLATVVVLAAEVAGGVPSWDRSLLTETHGLASPTLDTVMLTLADVGSTTSALAIAAVAAAVLVWRRRYRAAAFVTLAAAGSAATPLLKALVARPRPAIWPRLEPVSSFSFPSGHALASTLVAAALCLLLWRTRWRWPMLLVGVLFVLAVGFSRVYLGVHYPSDVLASWSVALVWLGLLNVLPRLLPRSVTLWPS